ncbi:MAG TPA: transglutaminase-like domain-containing protein [Methylomirabilota bacterium]|nr:transglutaminase-like domain-containing protein [Methylomirabilota bacterium]
MTPPGLLGAALLFWGWQTGFFVVGVVMAAVVEGRHLVRSRWDLARADFNRVSDLSAVLLVLIAVYQFVGTDAARAVLSILEWLPLTVFPLVACQVYSEAGVVDLSIFFWSLRRRANERPDQPRSPVDLTYPFVALTLLSASAANVRTGAFFGGIVVLAGWALWSTRPRRYPMTVWAVTLAIGVGLGWAGHVGIATAQRAMERLAQSWLLDLIRRETDPFKSSTALGEIGEVKLSTRILLRVESPEGRRPPALLREATYNVYNAPAWYAVDAAFASVQPESDGATWKLGPAVPERGAVTVSAYLRRGKGILPNPSGARQLDNLLVVELARNPLGSVRVDEGLGLVRYGARFGDGTADAPPRVLDLVIPRNEARAVARAAAELGLADKSPEQAVIAVRAWFSSRFRYSRFQGERPQSASALEDFFFRTRAGHCEYFATGTVLLLRAAGIPARYAIGYAVHEWSPLERRWVVRANDAHAWTSAWVGGTWREIDTTPGEWMPTERESASVFTPLDDLWSWATFLFSRWRWSEREDRLAGSIGWLLVPLIALLGWRLYRRRRVATGGAAAAVAGVRPPRPGEDSAFYLVERRLGELAFPRAPGESLTRWLGRVEAARLPAVTTAGLFALLALHYRYRFDPAGLGATELSELDALSRTWVDQHAPAAD